MHIVATEFFRLKRLERSFDFFWGQMFKIAIPSDNETHIQTDFNKATGVIVYNVHEERVERDEFRPLFVHSKNGVKKEFRSIGVGKARFERILRVLKNVELIIVNQIKPEMRAALAKHGIDVRICPEKNADETAREYAERTLVELDIINGREPGNLFR